MSIGTNTPDKITEGKIEITFQKGTNAEQRMEEIRKAVNPLLPLEILKNRNKPL